MPPDRSSAATVESAALCDPLLILLLEKAVNTSPELERLLLGIRRDLLRSAAADDLPATLGDAGGEFLAALAQQCFLNEYAFFESAEETAGVETLSARLAVDLDNRRIDGLRLALLATYRPLWTLPFAAQILRHYLPQSADYLYKVLRLQLIGPLHENGLRDRIARLTPIRDAVSVAVRDQYEQNPYPRWLYLDHHEPRSVGDYLQGVLPGLPAQSGAWPAAPRILVAGCGTGKQAISAALRFANCQVLGLDLSRASLAYGQRMSSELNVTNVEYACADILELPASLAPFDIVECVGVLHHLADPLDGLRRLLDHLNPGGLIRVGLYSRRARELLNPARRLARERGWQGDEDSIRAFRKTILDLPSSNPQTGLLRAADFFSTSECRDLVFHVNEHEFSLAEIRAALAQFELEFLGFELADESVLDAYRRANPGDPAARDLARWQRFEQRHPDTFASMYQFWARRR